MYEDNTRSKKTGITEDKLLHTFTINLLAEVAGSLIVYVKIKFSMRALESAYLNGVARKKKISYRISLSGDETSLRMKHKQIFQR